VAELWITATRKDEWQELLLEARVKEARDLQMERKRLNQHIESIDCLQLEKKGLLIINHPELLFEFGFSSKNAAKRL
jgi:hypothetical protein